MSNKFKLAIMMSGGLDSYISYQYAQLQLGYLPSEICCVWVNLGQPYNHKEEQAIDKLQSTLGNVRKITCDILRAEFNNLPEIEEPKQIIPARNLLLASIGAMYGNCVWICALESEMHDKNPLQLDKSHKFYKLASDTLTATHGTKIVVETPFSTMSKADLIKWSLKNGITKEELLSTSTCYHENIRNCGQCGTCFKRKVGFILNDIEEQYHTDPFLSDFTKPYLNKLLNARLLNDYSHYTKKRVDETILALQKCNIDF
jgi:7-cyano-7-deazaguanine synthase in queuosine biosynthesis